MKFITMTKTDAGELIASSESDHEWIAGLIPGTVVLLQVMAEMQDMVKADAEANES